MPNLPVRDRADAKLVGVCAALARTWQIDPIIVRLAFVVVGLLTNGFALAVYAVLWAILPERGDVAPLHRLFPATRSWSWGAMATVALLVTALAAAATGTGPGAFVIFALAWLIVRFGFAGRGSGPATHHAPPPLPTPTTPFERSAHAWQQRLANIDAGRPADWVPEFELPPPPEPDWSQHRAPRSRGLRTWLGVLIALGTTWTGLAIASAVGVLVPPLGWMAATLGVLGLALLWGASPKRASRGRPVLLLPATLLAAVATLALVVPTQLPAAPVEAVRAAEPVLSDGTTHLPIGEHTLDLASRAVTDETVRYDLALGDLTLVVPREGNVVVTAKANLGDITLPDGAIDGFDVTRTWRRVTDPEAPTLTIEVSVGLGEVVVR